MDKTEFIEVRKVVSGKTSKENIGTQVEVYPVDSIFSFRAWHKGENDVNIKGEMTQLILRPITSADILKTAVISNGELKEVAKNPTVAGNLKTILIEESYEKFLQRMSTQHRFVHRADHNA